MSGGNLHVFRLWVAVTAASTLVCGIMMLAAPALAGPLVTYQNPALSRTLSMAESQHEIIMILLRKKEYAQAAEEADKIFQMDWPANEEPRLLKELLGLSNQFVEHSQHSLGFQLLDRNARAFKTIKSLVAIWKEKGYVLKKMGQDDKALECFRKAQQLEKSPPE